jgi:sigma-B regulation protein RsbU (phosphoserine phosphatase)
VDDKRKEKHLQDIDKTLDEIRNELKYTHETGDIYELHALQLLLQITKAMHSERNVYTLITMVLDSALSFAQAERAFLMLLDENDAPRVKMGRSYDGEYLRAEDFVISTSVVQQVLASMQPVILADAQADEEFKARQSIRSLKLRTIMGAPLAHGDQTLGLIYVDSKQPMARYSKHHLNVLVSLAEQASVAIHNAQKFETHQ